MQSDSKVSGNQRKLDCDGSQSPCERTALKTCFHNCHVHHDLHTEAVSCTVFLMSGTEFRLGDFCFVVGCASTVTPMDDASDEPPAVAIVYVQSEQSVPTHLVLTFHF